MALFLWDQVIRYISVVTCSINSLTVVLFEKRKVTKFMVCFSKHSTAQLYLADISSPQNRARTMAPVYTAFGVGTAFGPAIGGMLGASYGLNAPFVFVGSAMMSAAVLNYFTIKETKQDLSEAKSSINIMKELRSTVQQWKSIVSDKTIRSVLTLNTTFWMVHTGSQLAMIPFILNDRFGFSVYNMGTVFAMSSIISVVCAQPFAALADRFGRRATILPGISIVCSCLLTLPYITQSEHVVALLAVWAAGAAMLGTAPLAQVVDAASTPHRAQAMALFRSSGDLGLLLGGAALGSLAQTVSLQLAATAPAALLAAAGLGYYFYGHDVRKIAPG